MKRLTAIERSALDDALQACLRHQQRLGDLRPALAERPLLHQRLNDLDAVLNATAREFAAAVDADDALDEAAAEFAEDLQGMALFGLGLFSLIAPGVRVEVEVHEDAVDEQQALLVAALQHYQGELDKLTSDEDDASPWLAAHAALTRALNTTRSAMAERLDLDWKPLLPLLREISTTLDRAMDDVRRRAGGS